MLAQFVRNFYRALSLQPHVFKTIAALKPCHNLQNVTTHSLSIYCPTRANESWKSSTVGGETTVEEETLTTLSENELAYTAPYITKEIDPRRNTLIAALRTRFRLSNADVGNILKNDAVSRTMFIRTRSLIGTLDMLCMEGVDKESFLNYPWLLTLDPVRLKYKLELIDNLPLRDINDFVPFLRLTEHRLTKLIRTMICESNGIPHGNRIYYISEMLKTNPRLVTKYLSKRLFVFEIPFEMLEENLQLMISYNISPQNLLRDLWPIRYRPKAVRLRLERAKRAKKNKIMPWMIRAPETILQRSFKLTIDEAAVLGDKKNVVEYVAERLGFDVESTKCIMNKHPAVMRVRVTKVKEILDYLLNEAGFTRHEIAAVPRILCHGLETTKQRIEELKTYGCRPSTLVILCRSKREYDKFLKQWLETHSKIRGNAEKNKSDTSET